MALLSGMRRHRVLDLVVACLLALELGVWFQSSHSLAVTVVRAPGTRSVCPIGVTPCFPIRYRISHRWFGHVEATCTVEFISPAGHVDLVQDIQTGQVPIPFIPVDGWQTMVGVGWVSLSSGSLMNDRLSSRCDALHFHGPEPA